MDKSWSRRRSKWTLYLDIQNVTGAKNPIFASYNYNYTQLVPGLYIPTLALLGVEVVESFWWARSFLLFF